MVDKKIPNKSNYSSNFFDESLWHCVSMSREQYCQIYHQTVENLDVVFYGTELHERAISALKLRKAFIIPTGIAPEDAITTSEKWTYVLFITVIVENRGFFTDQDDCKKWISETIPLACLMWLGREIGRQLISLCCGKSLGPRIPLLAIIKQARINHQKLDSFEINLDHFIAWIDTVIGDSTLAINTKVSRAHLVTDGLLIKKSLIDLYLEENDLEYPTEPIATALHHAEFCLGIKSYKIADKNVKNMVTGYLLRRDIFSTDLSTNTNTELVPA